MKASTLIKSQEVVLIFDGDGPEVDRTLNLQVNPGKLTPADQAKIRQADEEDMEPLVTLLLEMVEEWDLMDDKGKVIALKHESLMNQPIIVLALILNGISEDLQAQAEEQGKISAAT